ncbi:lipase family protein [Haloechinothrix sp. LS1_15]|uniref:lipase family protein n=1 Tax=Haloechinothrix sp. LS1_15 TaxID=2652248 RepID=UPI002944CAA9|nr:alpha/beta fold hydrolase [Haloechinothrix sp. LS1_15]MDV6014272.1 alpha/beta fold hydrolase [Haloechinothrix sp. LS1_15]
MYHIARRGIALAVAATAATATMAVAAGTGPPQATADDGVEAADQSFYQPPDPLPEGEPGDVIRHEEMSIGFDTPWSADAHRVMYLSTDTHGEAMAVTGAVLTPTGPWFGLGDRPVVGLAPGTHGMGDDCAPSRRIDDGTTYELPFIQALLERGYGVAVTDYQNLGTPDDHTYTIRQAQGNATLDVIRAAQRLPEAGLPDAGPVATVGYSQGGGASAAAGELASTYAPELDLRGSYAGAPPADLAEVARFLDGSHAAGLVGYAVLGFNEAYPELEIMELLNEKGRELAEEVRQECVEETVPKHAFTRSEDLTEDGRPISDFLDEEPYRTRVLENQLGTIKPEVPTLVLHSRADDIVPYEQGRQMARDWCDLGASVRFRTLTSATHVGAVPEASTKAAMWLEERFSGMPHIGNCGTF